MSPHPTPKILVIRRDNIGDLVCTTPLIAALRRRLPDAWLGALVNSYNAPVLDGNPDLDRVFVYTKAKHRARGESLPGILGRRLMMMHRLRQMQLDDVIIATTAPQPRLVRLARWLNAKRIIGFGAARGLDVALPLDQSGRHEVEDVFRVAALYGIDGPPAPCRVVAAVTCPQSGIDGPRSGIPVTQGDGMQSAPAPARCVPAGTPLTVGIHISARKPSQRWPADRFAATIRAIAAQGPVRFLLLWSPGADDNPLHPGDDAKAHEVLARVGAGETVIARPTQALPELIAALAECDALICADGGAMHLGAGLGLPIVCLFGNSGAQRWRPWGVPYRLLQKPSLDVADIGVDQVVSAFASLNLSQSSNALTARSQSITISGKTPTAKLPTSSRTSGAP